MEAKSVCGSVWNVFFGASGERLIMTPQIEFMKETDGRRDYFTQLVVAYSRVLRPSKKLSERGAACMETVLKGFIAS